MFMYNCGKVSKEFFRITVQKLEQSVSDVRRYKKYFIHIKYLYYFIDKREIPEKVDITYTKRSEMHWKRRCFLWKNKLLGLITFER